MARTGVLNNRYTGTKKQAQEHQFCLKKCSVAVQHILLMMQLSLQGAQLLHHLLNATLLSASHHGLLCKPLMLAQRGQKGLGHSSTTHASSRQSISMLRPESLALLTPGAAAATVRSSRHRWRGRRR